MKNEKTTTPAGYILKAIASINAAVSSMDKAQHIATLGSIGYFNAVCMSATQINTKKQASAAEWIEVAEEALALVREDLEEFENAEYNNTLREGCVAIKVRYGDGVTVFASREDVAEWIENAILESSQIMDDAVASLLGERQGFYMVEQNVTAVEMSDGSLMDVDYTEYREMVEAIAEAAHEAEGAAYFLKLAQQEAEEAEEEDTTEAE